MQQGWRKVWGHVGNMAEKSELTCSTKKAIVKNGEILSMEGEEREGGQRERETETGGCVVWLQCCHQAVCCLVVLCLDLRFWETWFHCFSWILIFPLTSLSCSISVSPTHKNMKTTPIYKKKKGQKEVIFSSYCDINQSLASGESIWWLVFFFSIH